jgi:hypothetical protein
MYKSLNMKLELNKSEKTIGLAVALCPKLWSAAGEESFILSYKYYYGAI